MTSHDVEPDPQPTTEQLGFIEALSEDQIVEIDKALVANCIGHWRKVAAVIGYTMTGEFMELFEGIPDAYCAQRIRRLVDNGTLESAGNPNYMRYSEVRLTSE